MDIDDLVRKKLQENEVASTYFAGLLREAHNKYVNLTTSELDCHVIRIKQEIRLFGPSFRTAAGLHIIKLLLEERSDA